VKPVKVKALGDLKLVKRALAEQARQRVLQASQEVKAVQQAASDKDLFVRAGGGGGAPAPPPPPRPPHPPPRFYLWDQDAAGIEKG
jgi:hypothetical protein